MKENKLIFIFFLLATQICNSQINYTISVGESRVHKTSDNDKALNEAILDAQTNAVILYGGNVNVLNTSTSENKAESKKSTKDKKYKNSGSFSSKNKFLLQNSISAMVKNIEIKADTLWLTKRKYKVRVNGTFDVNLKDLGTNITDFLNDSEQKIKIEVKENDCYGQIYKPMSEYINSKQNNFLFSNQPWLLGESDFAIEINSDRAVLYDKRIRPNIVIKSYSYKNCQSLLNKQNEENKILNEMISDMYAVYILNSIK
jgi:hypothetical protein